MKLITKEKNLKPRRKIFPGLGGIKKKYIRKGKILGTALKTLSFLLKNFIDENEFNHDNKQILISIKNDIAKMSEYEKIRSIDFYLLCIKLLEKYNINNIFN